MPAASERGVPAAAIEGRTKAKLKKHAIIGKKLVMRFIILILLMIFTSGCQNRHGMDSQRNREIIKRNSHRRHRRKQTDFPEVDPTFNYSIFLPFSRFLELPEIFAGVTSVHRGI
ncbi:MAG: hypothetical protein QGF55_02110 [SAR324 cluster bacterium]|nr:hypothetical protein [SAR324 cluster bacterium]